MKLSLTSFDIYMQRVSINKTKFSDLAQLVSKGTVYITNFTYFQYDTHYKHDRMY